MSEVTQEVMPLETPAPAPEPVVEAAPIPEAVKDVASEFNIPAEAMGDILNNDPDFKAAIEGKKPDGNKGGEDHGDGSTSGADAPADEQSKKPPADGKDAGVDGTLAGFADDVIPGLKGEAFSRLPEEAQEAVAKFYEEAQGKMTRAAALEATLEALKRDPVLRGQVAAAEAGRPVTRVERGLTAQEEKNVARLLAEQIGLSDDEAVMAVTTLKKGIEEVARDMAQELAAQSITQQESLKQAADINKQGDELLLGLKQYDKTLAVKETNLANFYEIQNGKCVYNEKHPEIAEFKNGLGRIIQWAGEHGIGNAQAVRMGAKAFYAAAAADLGKAVAINTAERDKKIAAEARRSAINLFRKSGGGTLATQGSASVSREDAEGAYIHNGVDVKRLVTDGNYYEELVAKRPYDRDWIEKLSELEVKGQELLTRKKSA